MVQLLVLALAAAFLCRGTLALPLVVLDTDIGTDFDDTWSLMYLLSRSIPSDPNRIFDLGLVQCSTYNTTNRARIASKILYDLGRFDVPVAVGLYTGEDAMNQLPVVGGFELSDFVAAGGTVYYGSSMAAARSAFPSGIPWRKLIYLY